METAKIEKATLDDLLSVMDRVDQGDDSFTEDQLKDAARMLEIKVDDYKEKMDWLQKRAELMRERAQEFSKAAQTLENQQANVSKLLLWNMQVHNFEKLAGQDYKVKLSERSDVEITLKNLPDSTDYIKYPELVERKYAWKRNELKALIKKDPEQWINFGKPVKKPQLYWSVNKEGLK